MFIYLIRCSVNGKVYVGKTQHRRGIAGRWRTHVCNAKTRATKGYLYSAMRKHGIENFTISELCRATSKEELNKLECHYILHYRSYLPQFGYNLTMGGEGEIPNESARLKMSIAKKGHKPTAALEARRKWLSEMSAEEQKKTLTYYRVFGEGNSFFGKHHTEECRVRMSKAKKGWAVRGSGWNHTEETKAKMRACWVIRRAKKAGLPHEPPI